jgi:hypothetical protein
MDLLVNRDIEDGIKPEKKTGKLPGATPFDAVEATTGFEPVVRALQAPALPLGHVAEKRAGQLSQR